MKKTLQNITIAYYAVYIAAILSAMLGYYILKSGYTIDPLSQWGVTISSALIILIIGSIPATLAVFHKLTKKWAKLTDEEQMFRKYRNASVIRILIIGLGLVAGILFFYILNSQSMIFCAGISAIALFFCKPNEGKIASDLKLNEPED